MAKAKAKKSTEGIEPPKYTPYMYIDLDPRDANLVDKLEIGKRGTFRISGKIVGLEKRVAEDRTMASVRLEDFRVKAEGSNAFSEMADEDED